MASISSSRSESLPLGEGSEIPSATGGSCQRWCPVGASFKALGSFTNLIGWQSSGELFSLWWLRTDTAMRPVHSSRPEAPSEVFCLSYFSLPCYCPGNFQEYKIHIRVYLRLCLPGKSSAFSVALSQEPRILPQITHCSLSLEESFFFFLKYSSCSDQFEQIRVSVKR